jgi:hypothetical protein
MILSLMILSLSLDSKNGLNDRIMEDRIILSFALVASRASGT